MSVSPSRHSGQKTIMMESTPRPVKGVRSWTTERRGQKTVLCRQEGEEAGPNLTGTKQSQKRGAMRKRLDSGI